jgi:hypothetical protein
VSRVKRGAIGAAVAVVVVVLGFLAGGGEIWRPGFSAGCCYLMSVILGVTAFLFPYAEDKAYAERFIPDTPEPPTDKTKMHQAVLAGVLDAIKGLVVRSENAEREMKEVKARLSDLSLAAGLKPRAGIRPANIEPKP